MDDATAHMPVDGEDSPASITFFCTREKECGTVDAYLGRVLDKFIQRIVDCLQLFHVISAYL